MVVQGLFFNGCLLPLSHGDPEQAKDSGRETPGGLFKLWSETDSPVTAFKHGCCKEILQRRSQKMELPPAFISTVSASPSRHWRVIRRSYMDYRDV